MAPLRPRRSTRPFLTRLPCHASRLAGVKVYSDARLSRVGSSLLSLSLNDSLRLRRQLKDHGLLTFLQECQEHDSAIWEFKCVVMCGDPVFVDLPKDCRAVVHRLAAPREKARWKACNCAGKRQFRSWPNADRNICIFRCCKPSCASSKVACRKLIANSCGSGFHIVKAEIAHVRLPIGSPLRQFKLSHF